MMDCSPPHATVFMDNSIEAARYAWHTEELVGGHDYRFAFRMTAAAIPADAKPSTPNGPSRWVALPQPCRLLFPYRFRR